MDGFKNEANILPRADLMLIWEIFRLYTDAFWIIVGLLCG